jgi:hypothetical protein
MQAYPRAGPRGDAMRTAQAGLVPVLALHSIAKFAAAPSDAVWEFGDACAAAPRPAGAAGRAGRRTPEIGPRNSRLRAGV